MTTLPAVGKRGLSERRKTLAGWFGSSGKRLWQSGLIMGEGGDRELCGFKRHLESKINDKFNVGGSIRGNLKIFGLHTLIDDGSTH